ncbi:MAG: hypothetical protein MI784_01750 [Cytophagales bacterium]|nr:hypothetical protein [Cytophagales bacterium]
MKKLFTLILVLFLSGSGFAQVWSIKDSLDAVMRKIEKQKDGEKFTAKRLGNTDIQNIQGIRLPESNKKKYYFSPVYYEKLKKSLSGEQVEAVSKTGENFQYVFSVTGKKRIRFYSFARRNGNYEYIAYSLPNESNVRKKFPYNKVMQAIRRDFAPEKVKVVSKLKRASIYINGKKVGYDTLNNLDPNMIESVSVIKDKSVKDPNGEVHIKLKGTAKE